MQDLVEFKNAADYRCTKLVAMDIFHEAVLDLFLLSFLAYCRQKFEYLHIRED